MKVTLGKALAKSGRTSYLWAVHVDGEPIDGGRVLKMGPRYLPVLDGSDDVFIKLCSMGSRKDAAQIVANVARREGRV